MLLLIKYWLSITPKPYELALTPEDIHDGKQQVMKSMVSTADGNKKWKWLTKSVSVVEESREEGGAGPSKKAKVESMGPTENEEELEDSSKWISGGLCGILISL